MVTAVRIDAPEAVTLAVTRVASLSTLVPQLTALGVYNVPAQNISVTYGEMNSVYSRIAQGMPITQSVVVAIFKGTVNNPKLTAWTYTLDGHDYYVLKLGTDNKTLVFDISTGQWSWWASPQTEHWRVNTGLNWKSSGNLPFQYGSNVVVGDDSYGVLWVLNPDQGLDDSILDSTQNAFSRVATAQMTSIDRQFIPIYSVYLSASLGAPALTANTVTLRYSDDQGRSFTDADDVKVVTAGDYSQSLEWRSLGILSPPGRLFQIEDNGAFSRIDDLEVNFQQG